MPTITTMTLEKRARGEESVLLLHVSTDEAAASEAPVWTALPLLFHWRHVVNPVNISTIVVFVSF